MNGDVSKTTLPVSSRLIHCPLIKTPFKRLTNVLSGSMEARNSLTLDIAGGFFAIIFFPGFLIEYFCLTGRF